MTKSAYGAIVVLCLLCTSANLALAQMGMGMAMPPGMDDQNPPAGRPSAQPNPADVEKLQELAGTPFVVEIHCHSTYSDGSCSIAELAQKARSSGIQILVVTDHSEDLGLNKMDFIRFGCNPLNGLFADEAGMLRAINKTSGIENYLSDCLNASDDNLLVIPGIEVGIGTPRDRVYDANGRWDNLVHMLGVGWTSPALVEELNSILGLEGLKKFSRSDKYITLENAQASVARTLHEYGLATVIAHPYLPDPFHPGHHYTVYKNQLRDDVDAIEFFNTTLVGRSLNTDPMDNFAMEAMGFINRDADQGAFKPLAVTAGCDYHGHSLMGFDAAGEEAKWRRITAMCLRYDPFEYMRGGNRDYQAACQVVADALRDRNTVIFAYSGAAEPTIDYMKMYCNGECLSTINQNGSVTRHTARTLSANDYVYMHVPGTLIARVRSGLVFNGFDLETMIDVVDNSISNNRSNRGGTGSGRANGSQSGRADGEGHGVQILLREAR